MGYNPTGDFWPKMHQPPKSMSGRVSPPAWPGGWWSVTAAGGAKFLQRFFDGFAGFAGALLYPADQFILLAVRVAEVVVRELGPFLFELALGDVPVAFDFECVHNFFCFFVRRRNDGRNCFPRFAVPGRPFNPPPT